VSRKQTLLTNGLVVDLPKLVIKYLLLLVAVAVVQQAAQVAEAVVRVLKEASGSFL
jgi:hypothetical protein